MSFFCVEYVLLFFEDDEVEIKNECEFLVLFYIFIYIYLFFMITRTHCKMRVLLLEHRQFRVHVPLFIGFSSCALSPSFFVDSFFCGS